MISSDRDDEKWEYREVRKFGRLRRPGSFGGYRGQEIWEVGGIGRIGRILSPVMNVFLQLHVDCVRLCGDYRTERLVHSINVVLHVQIHINVSIYYSVVHHVRILDKDLSGTRTHLL
jgi:hypothetical protein